MRFEVLGPVRLLDGRGAVRLSDQRRLLLAILVAHANRPVGNDVLAAAVWGERQPDHPGKSMHLHIHRLRKVLDRPERLRAEPGAYVLEVGPGELDADEFTELVRRAGEDGSPVELLRQALALWRGDAYAGLDEPGPHGLLGPERNRLAELRLSAYEDLYTAELAAGSDRELVPELTELVTRYPLRESLTGQLMLALYRSGRRNRALTTYRQTVKRLATELGSKPGPRLRELYDQILADDLPSVARDRGPDASASRQPAGGSVPAQLAPVPGGFVGRAAELAELEHARADQAAALILVTGRAGVGKTSTLVRYAHAVADRFGDGQLYLDLRGHASQRALEPVEALGYLLRSLGADTRNVPAGLDEAAAEYRSRTSGRKLLVLLDNAASADQVRPLLPASPGCLTLVTSRDRLSGLVAAEGAYRLTLEPLPAADARGLLARLLGKERVAAEPVAVNELIEACARLPLALRISAAQLADQEHRSVADYVTELRRAPLSVLRIEADERSAVGAAFDLSYQRLDPGARRLLRLLGLVPGPDVSVDAAAALTGTARTDVRRHLGRLAGVHLVEESAAGRFRLHDLHREYARQRAEAEDPAEERVRALDRVFSWYQRGKLAAFPLARPASEHLAPPPAPEGVPEIEFATSADMLRWLAAEHRNLAAAVTYAADHGLPHWAWHLVLGYTVVMSGRGYLADVLALAGTAEQAAGAAGDEIARAHVLSELGTLQSRVDVRQAAATLNEALQLAERIGDLPLQAYCLNSLGARYQDLGDLDAADACLTRSLAIKRATGEQVRLLAPTLSNLGRLACQRGDLRTAVQRWEEVLELRSKAPPRESLGTWSNLLEIKPAVGDLDGIEALFDHAERQAADLDEPAFVCRIKLSRAQLLLDLGRHGEALDLLASLLPLAEQVGQPRLVAQVDVTFGAAHLRTGARAAAIAVLERAVAATKATGDIDVQADALCGLAAAECDRGRWSEAESLARQARDLARSHERVKEADSTLVLARAELGAGRAEAGHRHATQAYEMFHAAGHLLGQARALRLLSDLDGEDRAERLRSAWRLFDAYGAPEAGEIATDLRPGPGQGSSTTALE